MPGNNQIVGSIQQEYPLPLPVRPIEFSDGLLTDSVHEENNNWTWADDESELGHILRGFLEKKDEKSHAALKKVVSRFNKDVPVEEAVQELLHEVKENHPSVAEMMERVKRKVMNSSGATRDVVNGDFQTSSYSEGRLERFKIKTVNVAGVGPIQEEQ